MLHRGATMTTHEQGVGSGYSACGEAEVQAGWIGADVIVKQTAWFIALAFVHVFF
jgi:hypothetical protein